MFNASTLIYTWPFRSRIVALTRRAMFTRFGCVMRAHVTVTDGQTQFLIVLSSCACPTMIDAMRLFNKLLDFFLARQSSFATGIRKVPGIRFVVSDRVWSSTCKSSTISSNLINVSYSCRRRNLFAHFSVFVIFIGAPRVDMCACASIYALAEDEGESFWWIFV